MSWSVMATGRPEAVKKAINEQFGSCLPQLAQDPHLKHEHASAALAQESIEAQLNFLIEQGAECGVKVHANGLTFAHGAVAQAQINLKVEMLPMFVG